MPGMDIFNDDAFSLVELTQALEKTDHLPTFLGDMGIFEFVPVAVETIAIEKVANVLALIPTSNRGAPLDQQDVKKRDIRDFRTVRIGKTDTVNAAEIQNIRAFGSMSEFQQIQTMIQRRQGQLRNDLDLTLENMRLGAIQGIVLDSDGIAEIANWFTNFGISQAAEIDFAMQTATTNIRAKCALVRRQMQRAAKGAFTPATQIHALVGDAFYDDLIDHDQVAKTFINWTAAADLRDNKAFESFPFGGITFHNYRGTDDNSTVAVGVDKAKFFPVNAPGVFQVAHSPGESFDLVNTPGLEAYSMIIPDRDRNAKVTLEVTSYPLHICTRPEMLQSAKRIT